MRSLFSMLFVLVLASTNIEAQQASIKFYGKACPNTAAKIAITGLPKIGTTLRVRASSMLGCTRKFCACACCDCNDCNMSILVLGASKISIPLPFTPSCTLLANLDLFLLGNPEVIIPIPNDARLLKLRFYLQRLDLSLKEVRGTQCATTYRLQGAGTSNGAECVVGV